MLHPLLFIARLCMFVTRCFILMFITFDQSEQMRNHVEFVNCQGNYIKDADRRSVKQNFNNFNFMLLLRMFAFYLP